MKVKKNIEELKKVIKYLFQSQFYAERHGIYKKTKAWFYTWGLQFSFKDETNMCEIAMDGLLAFSYLGRLIRAVVFGGWFMKKPNLITSWKSMNRMWSIYGKEDFNNLGCG